MGKGRLNRLSVSQDSEPGPQRESLPCCAGAIHLVDQLGNLLPEPQIPPQFPHPQKGLRPRRRYYVVKSQWASLGPLMMTKTVVNNNTIRCLSVAKKQHQLRYIGVFITISTSGKQSWNLCLKTVKYWEY